MNTFTLPLTRKRTAVYDGIYDAEDRLVAFIGMDEHSAEWAARITDTINAHDDLVGALQAALVLCNTLPDRQVEIAYKGYKDFSVRDTIQAALALAGKAGG